MKFEPFRKIARFSRDIIVSEKIDGTSAVIGIGETGEIPSGDPSEKSVACIETLHGPVHVYAGSRNRWLQPGKLTDNYGFGDWVAANAKELLVLGPGRHFGEWWGRGINRGYGMAERRLSFFNVTRWAGNDDMEMLPEACDIVPVLYEGPFDSRAVDATIESLRKYGSIAAPGYMKPEGIVVFHSAGNFLLKKTIDGDEKPKSMKEAA